MTIQYQHHGAIEMSSCDIVYGRKPPLVASYLLGTSKVCEMDHTLNTRATFLSPLKGNLVLD
jgi:hypothetical protein